MPRLPRPARKEVMRKPTSDQAFYHSAAWKKARKEKLKSKPICEVHEFVDYYVDCTSNSPVDHIVPIELDGAKTDQNNLMTLCKGCHERKSALELHRGILVETTKNCFGELIPIEGGRELVIRAILNNENL